MPVILPNVPNVVRFAVGGSWAGQPTVNVFHAQYAGAALNETAIDAACAELQTAYNNAFVTIMSNTFSTTSTRGVDLSTRQSAVGSGGTSATGGQIQPAVSSVQVALCISWTISDRYRGGHPRSYMPGLAALDTDGHRLLTDTGHTKWDDAAAGFLTDVNAMIAGGTTWRLCCVRYFSQHQLNPVPPVRLINTSVVHRRLDSQRRRLGKEVA